MMIEKEFKQETKEQETKKEPYSPKKKRTGISWKQKYIELQEKTKGFLEEEPAQFEEPEQEPETKYNCPYCNSEVKAYTPFCWNCGKKLNWSD